MGFGPLVNFWTFRFGLLWTEKMGLYTYVMKIREKKKQNEMISYVYNKRRQINTRSSNNIANMQYQPKQWHD